MGVGAVVAAGVGDRDGVDVCNGDCIGIGVSIGEGVGVGEGEEGDGDGAAGVERLELLEPVFGVGVGAGEGDAASEIWQVVLSVVPFQSSALIV